jgi:hypothetical protein
MELEIWSSKKSNSNISKKSKKNTMVYCVIFRSKYVEFWA